MIRRYGHSRLPRLTWIALPLLAAGLFVIELAARVDCPLGDAVAADIGDGVVMHTCVWQKAPDEVLRVGPLLLVKNGIPILSAQTNGDGQLHGPYLTWSDAGKVTARGDYRNGRRQGAWLFVDEIGRRTTLLYIDGHLIGR